MIALAALGKTHSILEAEKSTSLLTVESLEIKTHRDYSLRQYAKGLALMKQAIAAGDQDLRITLLTCLLIICIECLHGNFPMAGVQVSNGMALLREWRKGYPNAKEHPVGLSSPAPHLIEDSLVQMLGGLEVQSISVDDKTPQYVHQTSMEESHSMITNMPIQFQSFEESRIYLELLIKRSKIWLTSLGAYHKPLVAQGSGPSAPSTSHNDSSNFHVLTSFPSSRHHSIQVPHQSQNVAITAQRAVYLKDFHRWKQSFEALTGTNPSISTHPSFKDQLLAFKCTLLILESILSGNETILDQYSKDMSEILHLAEGMTDDVSERRNGTTFTIYQRFTGPPYFVGLHCRVGAVRRRASKLVDSLPKTRLSDNLLMSVIVQWVMEFEEEVMADGQIPDYERIRNMSVSSGVSSGVSTRESTVVSDYESMTDQGIV